jgi:hypothetical protein
MRFLNIFLVLAAVLPVPAWAGMTLSDQMIAATILYKSASAYGDISGVGLNDALAAVQAVDAALDTSLSSTMASFGPNTTLEQAFGAVIPAPWSGLNQKQNSLVGGAVFTVRYGVAVNPAL